MKIIDFDKLFDEYVQAFLDKTKGKYTAEQLEDVQPKLFEKFSKLKIANIGGLTPDEYYKSKKDELLDIVKEHIRRDIPVNDFLFDRLILDVSEQTLIDNLNPFFDGEYLCLIVELLSRKNSKNAFNSYIDLLFNKNIDENLKNLLIDTLVKDADYASEILLTKAVPDFALMSVCEILSHSKVSVNVTDFLILAINNPSCDIQILASFIVRYGDDSLLPVLKSIIERENLTYLEYKELKLAIEALGGECQLQRDFSFDKNYKIIKGLGND